MDPSYIPKKEHAKKCLCKDPRLSQAVGMKALLA